VNPFVWPSTLSGVVSGSFFGPLWQILQLQVDINNIRVLFLVKNNNSLG
jgi:hypothetical protein